MRGKLSILYDNLVLERAVKIEGYPVTKVIDVSNLSNKGLDDVKCIDAALTTQKIVT